MMQLITDHNLIDKMESTIFGNVTNSPSLFDTIHSKSLKLFGHIRRSSKGFVKFCLEHMVPGKSREQRKELKG